MRIDNLHVKNFRNIRELSLEASPDINIICGENAQGKTNILEAIWLFTGSRSFRGAKEADLVLIGENLTRLTMRFYGNGRDNLSALEYGARKKASLNEVDIENASKMAGNFTCAVFSPSHLSLIKEGPEERRRFIDTTILQLRPRYLKVLGDYHKILFQRNALLKNKGRDQSLFETLDIWDQSLAKLWSTIVKTRESYMNRLAPFAQELYSDISGGREELCVSYKGSSDGISGVEDILKALLENRERDRKNGLTGIGPHRDDLEILINGAPARNFGSQGQQRSAVLALKLAECSLMEEITGERPVVLLDDVMSELDFNRREFLLNRLSGGQMFITCCDAGYFSGVKRGKLFSVSGGEITRDHNFCHIY